jgi:N-acetylneuraminic acid mutarotase
MVIWGGRESSLLPTNTGGRYDPATDTWTPTSLNGALPSARRSHTAVWTGNRMIIWGGGPNESGLTNTGALYDPVADVWTGATSINNAPSSRLGHTAVWTGNRMIVWGGLLDVFHNVTASGGTYDPASNSWQTLPLAGAPSARQEHTAAWTGQAMLIWGGEDDSMAPVSFFGDGGRYDPASNAWSPLALAGAPQPRANSSATVTGDSMLVWGGINGTELQSGGRYCLCSASLFFADRDGDGHGDPSATESACAAPPGYVSDGSDCNDTSALIWSKPSEVQSLTLLDAATIQWSAPAQPGGTSPSYNLVRTSDKADFVTVAACVATGQAGVSAVDPDVPPVGAAFYYLVAAHNGCADGQGPWGANSQGQPIEVRTCP